MVPTGSYYIETRINKSFKLKDKGVTKVLNWVKSGDYKYDIYITRNEIISEATVSIKICKFCSVLLVLYPGTTGQIDINQNLSGSCGHQDCA